MNPRRRIAALSGLLVVLAMVLAGCTRPDQLPGEPEPVTLNIGATLEPTGLDPSTVSGAGTSYVLLYNVYETLVRLDSDNKLRPLLALGWSVSEDNLVYTFQLDPNARFASGTQVTADAVVQSFERAMEGDDIVSLVRNGFEPVASVEAEDDDTLVVTLDRVSHGWLYQMSGPAGIVYDPAGFETLNTEPAGSGPYVFESWDTGASITLAANPEYWGTGPRVDGVVFRYYADANAMNTAMVSGQLDAISNLTIPESLDLFEDEERFTVTEGLTHGEVVLGFNHTNEALSVLEVRQAINHAIDRRALLDTVWGGKGALIGSMVPPFDPWFEEDLVDYYDYDPEQARELLAEAGYASGLTLRLRVPTVPYGPNSARVIASQLGAVGITVQVEELEFGAWLQEVFTNKDYDMTIVAHVEPRDIGQFANPDYYWAYDNPAFAEALEEADSAPTEEAYVDGMREAARLLTEDAAADWLFLLPNIVVTTKEVSGIPVNAASLSIDLTAVATSR
ncbi:ABC transporter substrate-binding protein [Tessaracoccus sp. OS52]|uniref:ABC transporter substrate-binding protein n=1 Tax=Tessaracoccus sp. OS52 TaxID=2886691 RepID=UPI001D10DAB7|nr:ABC transporter substrate-binding protein [Tessaracoccus sp. OS52]MCC2593092.1 ABC transporter substrate-binding protein [Tessaracoccus sp. OS52]